MPTSEENFLSGAIAELKQDMKDGFDGVKGDLKELVTKGEFRAEIARVDSNHTNLKDSHNAHVRSVDAQFKANQASARWTLGLSVTIVGIAVGGIVAFIPH